LPSFQSFRRNEEEGGPAERLPAADSFLARFFDRPLTACDLQGGYAINLFQPQVMMTELEPRVETVSMLQPAAPVLQSNVVQTPAPYVYYANQ
jgi:hypothetical protein